MLEARAQQRWVKSQRLYFPSQARCSIDPVRLAEEISLICDLRTFDPLGSPEHYLHRSSTLLIGDCAVITAAFLPQAGETHDFFQCLVEIPLAGDSGTLFTLDKNPWHCRAGIQGMLLPGQAMRAHTEAPAFHLGLNLDPARLEDHLIRMAPDRFSPVKARTFLQRPHPINLQDPRVKQIVEFLQRYLQKMQLITGNKLTLPSPLVQGYEDVLYRATLLMILPELQVAQ